MRKPMVGFMVVVAMHVFQSPDARAATSEEIRTTLMSIQYAVSRSELTLELAAKDLADLREQIAREISDPKEALSLLAAIDSADRDVAGLKMRRSCASNADIACIVASNKITN